MENYAKELLTEELTRRKVRNPFYSLRAFARDLGVNRTTLSDVLGGRRQLSAKNIQKLAGSLALSETQKTKLRYGNALTKTEQEHQQLLEDTFKIISHWYYLAILNLAKLPSNSACPKWIAERLGIEVEVATEALERLGQLKFIEIKNHKMKRTVKPLTTPQDVPSLYVRHYHSEILFKAEQALHKTPVEYRDFASVTMAINPHNLPEAKKILQSCKRRLSTLLEKGKAKEVYAFSYQLFPLSQNKEKQENHG